ncbi:MAG: hypothetical protein JWM62_2187, partial [Frankiales bacterium]|nr:hypothetical protein [Frankiales bacterium]
MSASAPNRVAPRSRHLPTPAARSVLPRSRGRRVLRT